MFQDYQIEGRFLMPKNFQVVGVNFFAKKFTSIRMALTLAVSPAQAGAQFQLRGVLHKT